MPSTEVTILGINEFGQDASGGVPNAANLIAAEGRDIPLLQDTDSNQDGASDTWASAGATLGKTAAQLWREVLILGPNGDLDDNRNLTTSDLAVTANYDSLRQSIMDVATENRQQDPAKPWQNAKEPYDVNHDGFVTAVGDVLPLISWFNTQGLGDLPTPSGEITTYLDVTGNNKALASDAFAIIRHINLSSITHVGNAAAEPEAAAAALAAGIYSTGVSSAGTDDSVSESAPANFAESQVVPGPQAVVDFDAVERADEPQSKATCPGHAEATDSVFASALDAEDDDVEPWF